MMESQKYAIVDLETTGHSPANGDRMIQIAVVIMKDWEIERTYTKFINPGKAIPTFIQDLTHITNEDVRMLYHLKRMRITYMSYLLTVYLSHIMQILTYPFYKQSLNVPDFRNGKAKKWIRWSWLKFCFLCLSVLS